jgi:Cu2+-exporting ATPase
VLSIIELSTASYRKMKQNLWWAAGYNLISVPLAAGVPAPVGFVLPVSVGAILMSASTAVVALNALTVRRRDIRPGRPRARSPGGRGIALAGHGPSSLAAQLSFLRATPSNMYPSGFGPFM